MTLFVLISYIVYRMLKDDTIIVMKQNYDEDCSIPKKIFISYSKKSQKTLSRYSCSYNFEIWNQSGSDLMVSDVNIQSKYFVLSSGSFNISLCVNVDRMDTWYQLNNSFNIIHITPHDYPPNLDINLNRTGDRDDFGMMLMKPIRYINGVMWYNVISIFNDGSIFAISNDVTPMMMNSLYNKFWVSYLSSVTGVFFCNEHQKDYFSIILISFSIVSSSMTLNKLIQYLIKKCGNFRNRKVIADDYQIQI